MTPPPRRRPAWQLTESVAVLVVALAVVVVGLVSGVGGLLARIPEKTPTPLVIDGPDAHPSAVASRAEARAAARESARAQVASAAATREGNDLLATLGLVTMAGQPAWAAIGGVDLVTGERIGWTSPTYPADATIYTASVAKVILAEVFWIQRVAAGEEVSDDDIEVLDAMLSWSSNADADTIFDEIGGTEGMAAGIRALGLTHSVANPEGYWGLTATSVEDLLVLLENLTSAGGPVPTEGKQQILAAMGDVATDQDWGVGEVGTDQHLKNGWLDVAETEDEDGVSPDEAQDPEAEDGTDVVAAVPESWLLDSIGVVTLANGHRAHLVVVSQGWESQDEGIPLIAELAHNLVQVLER